MPGIIDKSKNLTSDVYGINKYVNEIKKDFTPGVNDDTLMLGIFGYTGQIFSDMLQNTIVMASEFSNESIPTRAKFEKNIIAHALGLGITDINAVPATMDILLTFVERDIENHGNVVDKGDGWTFTFDKDIPIYIGDFEFHTDYDIEISKVEYINSGKLDSFAYTARYNIDIDNPVSDVTNPYLSPPVKINVRGTDIIFTKCTIRQVEKQTIHKKVLSDNSIASKTVTFEFEGQLSAFTIDVTEGSNTTHLIPVYEGLAVEDRKYPHFYYSYLDSHTIRIKFDRSSYQPRINSDVQINIQTTQGEKGNFTYDPNYYPIGNAESEKFGYANVAFEIRPVTGEAANGTDKKSIETLKQLIPKEAVSRGSITNLSDLENFFNMLNTDNSILYFYKKRDNALERLYHSFIIMRDAYNVIIPTNTIDLKIPKGEVDESLKQIIKKDQCFKLVNDIGIPADIATVSEEYDANSFTYVIPYNLIINNQPLYTMYTLTVIDSKKLLDFSYINGNCIYQYIATSISLNRGYRQDPNKYSISINFEQNIDDRGISETQEANPIRVIAVFYNVENGTETPLRWAEAKPIGDPNEANIYNYRFEFTTNDYIDINNRIRITEGMYDFNLSGYFIPSSTEYGTQVDEETGETSFVWPEGKDGDCVNIEGTTYRFTEGEWKPYYSYAHMQANTKCVIHILSKQDGKDFGLNRLDQLIPNIGGYSLSNSYTVLDGVDFFYDYSNVISSTVTVDKDEETGEEFYTIEKVPVVKYDYFTEEGKAIDFCKELMQRKTYIDYAIQVLEDAFEMNFKFFNTYGPSKLFTIDTEGTLLNRTNLSLTFRLKLRANYDTNITNMIIDDIKTYIEDINSINTIHMPNLVSEIINKYSESIEYFEFIDLNGYGYNVQHLYSLDMPDEVIVPEFVNISALDDGTPDITLILM